MSVILPYQYKYIAEKLADAYAKVRDSLYKSSGESVYSIAQETLVEDANVTGSAGGVESADDTTIWGSTATSGTNYTAPPGSIAKDIGSSWYDFANSNFTETQAKSYASGLIGPSLKKLNSHIVKRMAGISTIASYYSTYAYTSDADHTAAGMDPTKGELSLFDYGGEPYSWNYFSEEFVELSDQIGITISTQWQA